MIHVIEGDVYLWEQEGGFCDSAVEIREDGQPGWSFAQRLAQLYGIPISGRGAPEFDGKLGRFRITIEKLGDG